MPLVVRFYFILFFSERGVIYTSIFHVSSNLFVCLQRSSSAIRSAELFLLSHDFIGHSILTLRWITLNGLLIAFQSISSWCVQTERGLHTCPGMQMLRNWWSSTSKKNRYCLMKRLLFCTSVQNQYPILHSHVQDPDYAFTCIFQSCEKALLQR